MDREVVVGDGARLVVRGVGEDGSVEHVSVELVEASGARWSATVLTLAEIERLMAADRVSGARQSGSFFQVTDLTILNEGTFEALLDLVERLFRDDALLTYVFTKVPPADRE